MTTEYSHYGDPNSPPTFTNLLPVDADEDTYVDVTFRINDLQDNIDLDTLDIILTFDPFGILGGPTVYQAMINGVWQSGYNGTITDIGLGYDVSMDVHPLFAVGEWQCDLYVEDDVGESAVATWDWGVVLRPALIGVRAIARRVIELEFDLPVKVRLASKLLIPPADRYTPVDWEGDGGAADDAANPANYVLARASQGNLIGQGEAVDIFAVYAEEAHGSSYESGGVIYSTVMEVTVDYQMTPRADYEITIYNLTYDGPIIREATTGFIGFVVSQVARNTLTFFGSLAEHHRRMDREGTEDLVTFLAIWQEVMDRILEDVDAFFWELCDIDKMRAEFLDNLLYDLGNPFAGMFDLTTNQKRKLAATLVGMYREKGTCEGIVNAVRFFVGVELSGCTDSWGTHWRLSTGTAAAPIPGAGGPYTLSDGPSSSPNPGSATPCYLAPSTSSDIWSFRVISTVALTQDERDKIEAVAEYMKPAATHYLGAIEP
jgi:phage tail-like protein